jgi:outer membrane receptor for ferrienterochelin and colicins
MRRILFWLGLFVAQQAFAQVDDVDVYEMQLGELSKLKVISASKTEQTLDEVPSTVRVITADDIAARGYYSIDDVLSDLPGFQSRDILSLNSYHFLRGLPNQNNLILVLVDGIEINELNSGGFYAGSLFNLMNVRQIEVVYGPSSVAYGTNAVAGVINIITKDVDSEGVSMRAHVGTFNSLASNVSYSVFNKNKDRGFRVAAMFNQSDRADLRTTNNDANWSDLLETFERNYAIDAKCQWTNWTVGANFAQKQTALGTMQKSVGTTYRDFGTLWNILFANAYLKNHMQLNPQFKVQSTLYTRNASVLPNTIYQITDTAQISYYRPNHMVGAEIVADWNPSGSFSLTSGVELIYEKLATKPSLSFSSAFDVNPPRPETPEMESQKLMSFFIEPQYVLNSHFFISGGARLDLNGEHEPVLTPRLALNYLNGNFQGRLSFSEAFRAPKPWDYTDGIGNSTLKPEKIKSFDGALSYSGFLHSRFEATVFRNLLYNGFFRQLTPDGFRWINENEIETWGTELVWSYFHSKVKTELNYALTLSEDALGQPVPEISKHAVNGLLTYVMSSNWDFSLRGNYRSARKNPKFIQATQSQWVDSYFVLNAMGVYHVSSGVDIRLLARNILNSEYYHTSNRNPDRYRQPQRSILLSVSYLID